MSLGIWPLMVKKDTLIISCINFLFKIKNFVLKKGGEFMRDVYLAETIYIILNGPSIKKQDLQKLKGKNVMFVNKGFTLETYKALEPKFHVFADPKLIDGTWSLEWLDQIVEKVPDITFVMPERWKSKQCFKVYIDKGYSFFWFRDSSPLNCLGVSGICFKASIFMGFKKIYFTGFEATGLPHELLKSSNSHFYGVDEHSLNKTAKDYILDLYMYSRQLNDLIEFSKKAKKKGVEMINLTEGGVLDMFKREKF